MVYFLGAEPDREGFMKIVALRWIKITESSDVYLWGWE